ncbi:DNA-binding MarR family transcriptional regulator [Catenulispora sp. GAS73]|uniref:MarR family winged helix-turn-helix transcriptional regulator n=1 Tax=Catenulispora sp. GAS73 TaxID=3156269 RepID=UPI0035155761
MAASNKRQHTNPRQHANPAQPPAADLGAMVSGLLEETALWQSFLGTHRRLVERLAEQMQTDHGLPLEWFDVLIHLADEPGARLRQRELRDRMLLSESGVSRMLARMAAAGLLERRPADDDRRGVEIALTDAGAQALAAALESHRALVTTSFTDRLTATDRLALEHILAKLTDPAEG